MNAITVRTMWVNVIVIVMVMMAIDGTLIMKMVMVTNIAMTAVGISLMGVGDSYNDGDSDDNVIDGDGNTSG